MKSCKYLKNCEPRDKSIRFVRAWRFLPVLLMSWNLVLVAQTGHADQSSSPPSAQQAVDVTLPPVDLKSLPRNLFTDQKQFWQRRYYDFNVHSNEKRIEKIQYIHRNPVTRGLVSKPEDYRWSSFNHYATGEPSPIEIESEWTARLREHAFSPC